MFCLGATVSSALNVQEWVKINVLSRNMFMHVFIMHVWATLLHVCFCFVCGAKNMQTENSRYSHNILKAIYVFHWTSSVRDCKQIFTCNTCCHRVIKLLCQKHNLMFMNYENHQVTRTSSSHKINTMHVQRSRALHIPVISLTLLFICVDNRKATMCFTQRNYKMSISYINIFQLCTSSGLF